MMKKTILSALGVIITYLIFITSWETSIKILTVSTVILAVILIYFFRAGGFRVLSLQIFTLMMPSFILFIFALLNFFIDLKFSVFSVWIGFIILTAVSFVLAQFFSKE